METRSFQIEIECEDLLTETAQILGNVGKQQSPTDAALIRNRRLWSSQRLRGRSHGHYLPVLPDVTSDSFGVRVRTGDLLLQR